MEKPADNEYPIHNLLRRRWSLRASSERPVEPAIWRSLFEARDGRELWSGLVSDITPDLVLEHYDPIGVYVDGDHVSRHRPRRTHQNGRGAGVDIR
jgi:hypothetical protein